MDQIVDASMSHFVREIVEALQIFLQEFTRRKQTADASVPQVPVDQPTSPKSKKGKDKSELMQMKLGCSDGGEGAVLEETIAKAKVLQDV